MNIGLFTDTYLPEINGVAASTDMLRDELVRRGHRVFVVAPQNPEHLAPQTDVLRLPSMPFFALPERRISLFYDSLSAKILRQSGLDIIHTQSEFSMGFFGRMMAKDMGVPHVHTYHTIYEDYTHYITRGLLDGQSKKAVRGFSKYFCNNCARILTPSAKTRDLLLDYGVEAGIDIVPTGIKVEKFDRSQFAPDEIAGLRASLGIAADAPVIINVGRISQEKNLDEVVKSIAPLFERRPEARFLLVGGGPHIDVLQKIAHEHGIGDKIIFAGERPWAEIGKYYALGDVFVSASTSETQGLTYIEAMSAGLPVVARRDRCIEGVVEHEESGLLFDEAAQIAPLLERALYDVQLRATLTRNALIKAQENSVTTFGDRVEKCYAQVLSDPAAPAVTAAEEAKRPARKG